MKTDKPIISVIVANFNGEKFLSQSVDSVLNQTFKDFELIVIDDNSKDNSQAILQEYIKKDKRIKAIFNKKNEGAADARNKGIKISKGKYIAILDSDDIAYADRFEKQFNFLEKNKDIFLVGGSWDLIDESGKYIRTEYEPIRNVNSKLERINCIHNPTIMFRNTKEFFYRSKLGYGEDYDLFLMMLTDKKKLTNMPDVILKYRMNSNSITFKNRVKQHLFVKKANEFYFQRKNTGKDEYDKFDQNSIFKLDTSKLIDKELLFVEIYTYFRARNTKQTRQLISKYCKHFSIFSNPKLFLYYFETYINLNFLRNMKNKLKRMIGQ